jgi:radical SAM superfamily enzyme YgiQ (UPF0313 family)
MGVGVLLVSTYDLGRQPQGLASPAARLRASGVEVECVDTSRDDLADDQIRRAGLVAFYLPMHTATRLAAPLLARVRAVNASATLAAYGLYAPLNANWLRDRGVDHVLGPEVGEDLVHIGQSQVPNPKSQIAISRSGRGSRLAVIQPDRTGLPPLTRYASVQMPDGTRRVAGSTEATRGCKHLCRHCPVVPVYRGTFTAVPLDAVMADVRAQVAAGAQHVTFTDPDFFNGPTHARRLVERLARECPGVSYDVTIKIEHLLRHAGLLPVLHDTGCLFVTSAVESIDDRILAYLGKGHTRDDFVRALDLCRAAGVALAPTFVPFTPWTTIDGYADLLDQIEALDLVEAVAPIQLAIRLLVTSGSALLELEDVRKAIGPFDPQALAYPWRHDDRRVDALQQQVMRVVAASQPGSRTAAFSGISRLARDAARRNGAGREAARSRVGPPPYMTEGWYCCAEPGPEQVDLV